MWLSHEHVFCRFRGDPEGIIPEVRRALQLARSAGVTDVVDLTPYGPLRSYESLMSGSDIPRVHGCIGFYRTRYVDKRHRTLDVAELEEVMARQLARRIAAGLHVVCIKVASDRPELAPLERRIMEAAARVSNRHGLPIVTHAIFGRRAQFEALTRAGANPERIMLSHTEMDLRGTTPRLDPDALARDLLPLLNEGASLCVTDLPVSSSPYQASIIALLQQLCDGGFERSICISGDARFTARRRGVLFARSRDYTTVPARLKPMLANALGDETTRCLTETNAARFYRAYA